MRNWFYRHVPSIRRRILAGAMKATFRRHATPSDSTDYLREWAQTFRLTILQYLELLNEYSRLVARRRAVHARYRLAHWRYWQEKAHRENNALELFKPYFS